MRPTRDTGLKEVEDILANKINKEEYDPHQDEEERRDIRRQYRSLQEKTLENRRDLLHSDRGEGIYEAMAKSNSLFDTVKNTQEAVLDSKFMVTISDLTSQKMQTVKVGTDTEISLDDFVSKVITASSEGNNPRPADQLDWEHIGKLASQFGKRAHTMDFMLGPLSVQRKEKRINRGVRLTKNKEDLVTPAKLQQGDIKKQENETANNVNMIFAMLEKVTPINYFKFVTNPESFSQTVENIFYVSFLVRKSVVGIDTSSGQPILSIRLPPEVDSIEDMVQKKQIIMGIDIKDWKDIINTYNITESCIPTRVSKETVTAGTGWY